MNRLQLVQEFCRLAGMTDTGGPTTTINQNGDYALAAYCIDVAHQEIQNLYFDWNFLWQTASLQTTAGTATYQGQSNIGIWDAMRVFCDGRPLRIMDYQDYVPDPNRENGPPEYGVILPNNQLLIVPTPDDAYTINYDYFRRPFVMTQNTDEPLIPRQYRRVIVGRALMIYGNFEAAEEIKIQGQELYEQYLNPLEAHETPRKGQRMGRAENMPITVIPV
jgi:hypothetical protein